MEKISTYKQLTYVVNVILGGNGEVLLPMTYTKTVGYKLTSFGKFSVLDAIRTAEVIRKNSGVKFYYTIKEGNSSRVVNITHDDYMRFLYKEVLVKDLKVSVPLNKYGKPNWKQFILDLLAVRDTLCPSTERSFEKDVRDPDFYSAGVIGKETITYKDYRKSPVALIIDKRYYLDVVDGPVYNINDKTVYCKPIVEKLKGLEFKFSDGKTIWYKNNKRPNIHPAANEDQTKAIKAKFIGVNPEELDQVDLETGETVEQYYMHNKKLWDVRSLSYDYIMDNLWVFDENTQKELIMTAEALVKDGKIPESLETFGDVEYLEDLVCKDAYANNRDED